MDIGGNEVRPVVVVEIVGPGDIGPSASARSDRVVVEQHIVPINSGAIDQEPGRSRTFQGDGIVIKAAPGVPFDERKAHTNPWWHIKVISSNRKEVIRKSIIVEAP